MFCSYSSCSTIITNTLRVFGDFFFNGFIHSFRHKIKTNIKKHITLLQFVNKNKLIKKNIATHF